MIPILGCMRIEAGKKGAVSVTATDLDSMVMVKGIAAILAVGTARVEAHVLLGIAQRLPAKKPITIRFDEKDDTRLLVAAGASRFSLPRMDPAEFPKMTPPGGTDAITFNMEGLVLKTMMRAVRGAVSTDQNRYYLTGPYFHASGDKLRAVATDGHRLLLKEVPLPEGAALMPAVILPTSALRAIEKIAPDSTIKLLVSGTKFQFSADGTVYISKLIEGTYPNYERVIPQEFSARIELSLDMLSKAVERVSTVASEKTTAIRFTMSENRLVISMRDVMGDEAEEFIPVSGGTDCQSGFNPRYLADLFAAMSTQDVELCFGQSGGPSAFRIPNDASFVGVVMPLRA